jgi:hypothetical protein
LQNRERSEKTGKKKIKKKQKNKLWKGRADWILPEKVTFSELRP